MQEGLLTVGLQESRSILSVCRKELLLSINKKDFSLSACNAGFLRFVHKTMLICRHAGRDMYCRSVGNKIYFWHVRQVIGCRSVGKMLYYGSVRKFLFYPSGLSNLYKWSTKSLSEGPGKKKTGHGAFRGCMVTGVVGKC